MHHASSRKQQRRERDEKDNQKPAHGTDFSKDTRERVRGRRTLVGQFESVVKGHDFSRAVKAPKMSGALAPEERSFFKLTHYPPDALALRGLFCLRDLRACHPILRAIATGADFLEFSERGANSSRPTGVTSDNEIGKIGPVPSGCGANRSILRCHPRLGITKAFVLRPRGPHRQVFVDGVGIAWTDFRSQRYALRIG